MRSQTFTILWKENCMRTAIAMFLLILLAAGVAADTTRKVVEGSGRTITEARNVGDFNALSLDIDAKVTVTPGETSRCWISAEENILPLIVTEVSGSTLRITSREAFIPNQPVAVILETPLLTSVALRGAGEIEMAEVTRDKLALAINGSGNIRAVGKVARLTAAINGSGNLNAADLGAGTGTITINGSGSADIHVTESLRATILGSGTITYGGSPPELQKLVNGSGKIIKK
ncbi:MAG: hypothetical protein C0622_03355 [Desulfuromonas sp.]|nr:MAG: hypothetical protein C0622_03355 [Desulfuromonas sp.]